MQMPLVKLNGSQNSMNRLGYERFWGMEVDRGGRKMGGVVWGGGSRHCEHEGNVLRTDLIKMHHSMHLTLI